MPTGHYPLGSVARASMVDEQLDNIFKVESLGIEETSKLDEIFIRNFDQSLELIKVKYYVCLPWYENVKDVKNIFYICRAVLVRVLVQLDRQNLYEAYNYF